MKTPLGPPAELPDAEEQWENEGGPCADESLRPRFSTDLKSDIADAPKLAALFAPDQRDPRLL